jgi:hypothetical protein
MTLTPLAMETLATAVVKVAVEEWKLLCAAALQMPEEEVLGYCETMAIRMKTGKDSIRRKVDAIRYQRTLGFSEEEIVSKGQEKVVSEWIKSRRQATYSETVIMKWQVPGDLRERVVQEVNRISMVLDVQNSTQFFEWLVAQLSTLTDEEIIHSAGDSDGA